MKKFFKFILIICIYIILILSLFSCYVKDIFVDDNNLMKETTSSYSIKSFMKLEDDIVEETTALYTFEPLYDDIYNDRKIVKNYNINCETKFFDETYDLLNNKINELNGIVDNQTLNNYTTNNTHKNRNLYITIRILQDYSDEFYDFINENYNILNISESKEDITNNYNSLKTRLATLQNEQKKLNELFNKADNIDDLVNIERRISEISYEIERLEKGLTNFDDKINYSIFYININEVNSFTEMANEVPTIEDMIIEFQNNLTKTKFFVINIFVYIFTHLPAICLILILFLSVLFISVKILNKNVLKKVNNHTIKHKDIINPSANEKKLINETSINDKHAKYYINKTNDTTPTNKSFYKGSHSGSNVSIKELTDDEILYNKLLEKNKDIANNKDFNNSDFSDKKDFSNDNNFDDDEINENVPPDEIMDLETLMKQKIDE